MPRRELIDSATTPDGEPLTLTVEGAEHVVRVRGEVLMGSRQGGSERAMAELALPAGSAARVLVGGLGIGFTLRAVLERAGAAARVDVVELFDAVVRWNRGPLARFAGRALDDPRVHVHVGDLLDHLAGAAGAYDAILLDVDNGPEAFTVAANARLYAPPGLALLHGALRARGVAVVWSAFPSRAFQRRLQAAGLDARSVRTRARAEVGKGARHWLFVAEKGRIG